jgi:hypothetical protein
MVMVLVVLIVGGRNTFKHDKDQSKHNKRA